MNLRNLTYRVHLGYSNLVLALLLPLSLCAQKGSYELSLSPYIKTHLHEGVGMGVEYFHRKRSSIGLFASTEFLQSKLDNLNRRYDTYRLTLRMHNYFQLFKNPNIQHYFSIYADGGLSGASSNSLDGSKRKKSAPDFSLGIMAGLLRFQYKKFAFKVDAAYVQRFYKTQPRELTRQVWTFSSTHNITWGANYFYRFSCSINYRL